LESRPIEDKASNILSSPCDGTILSITEVKELNELIIVKDIKYPILEFLFGRQGGHPELGRINIDKSKKMFQITIYLSPADCHRFYSPTNMYTNLRIYVPGFLEPVRLSYLEKHPKVLLTNERVTLVSGIEGTDDYVLSTFVGALNVGSINLTFDDFLKTNNRLDPDDIKNPGFYVLKYSSLMGQQGMDSIINPPQRHYYKPHDSLFNKSIEAELEEFDVRDIMNIDKDIIKLNKINVNELRISYNRFKERFIFGELSLEREDVKHNIFNNFLSYDVNLFKIKKKLKNSKQSGLEDFPMTNHGIQMNKRDELGWFSFGSTIVLMFTMDGDQGVEFKFKPGDKVKIGQSLYKLKNNLI
jgi:phosphatidylserine decarboxylase precursor